MDITALDLELRSNKIAPLYILNGPERHLALTAKKNIVQAILKDDKDQPEHFWAGKTSIHHILDILKTPSLLSSWRLVILEEADELLKESWDPLKKYFQTKRENQTLLMMGDAIRANYLKDLPKDARLIELKKLYPNQVGGWINMEARALGLSIAREAAQVLIDCVGTDLGDLYGALQKISLFVGARKLINLEDVENVVANTAQKNIFDLANAVGGQNLEKMFPLLSGILEEGEEPIKILAIVLRHFRLLAKAQDLLKAKAPAGDFPKQLKVHPFFVQEYIAQARRLDSKNWKKRFNLLAACDRSLKSSKNSKGIVLEKLFLGLAKL